MATYSLTLLIDQVILAEQSSDNLCIAKNVNGNFTTVFQDASVRPKRIGQEALLASNVFEWTDTYRVFATVVYTHGMFVQSATNQVDIGFGEQTTYGSDQFSPASPAAHEDFENSSGWSSYEDSFLANQVPKPFHAAIEMSVKGEWAPVYVDPDTHFGPVNKQLTPMNEYMLFWDNRLQASSMIDVPRLKFPFTFTFTGGAKSKTIRFGYAVPNQPTAGEFGMFRFVD